MKSAKEWAAEVLRTSGGSWGSDESGARIIERLVERVQADARAPLEEEVARLRAENERLNAEHVEYRAFIADSSDMLAEEHEQVRRANQ